MPINMNTFLVGLREIFKMKRIIYNFMERMTVCENIKFTAVKARFIDHFITKQ